MKRSLLLAGLVLSLAVPAYAGPAKPAPAPVTPVDNPEPPQKPTLVVAISVDQFSADLFAEYRSKFTGGLKRLEDGVVFPSGYQSHAATETCPGHSTILTGSRPARTGIIANNWMEPGKPRVGKDGKPDYSVYCAEDESVPGSNSANYTVSTKHLKVPTLGDRLKAVSPQSRVVAVSGKDRAALMMGGHNADLELYWDGKAFVALAGKEAALPAALAKVNASANAAIAKDYVPILPATCAARSHGVEVATGYVVGKLQTRKAADAKGWRATPDFDSKTMDLALGVQSEMKLGQGPATDVLAISMSATDYVGHTFGTEGAESCTQLMALDATLGRLFSALDKAKVKYVAVLTADHGGHDAVERNDEQGLPAAQRVTLDLFPAAMGKAIGAQFGMNETALIGDGPFGDIYLTKAVPAEKRDAVLTAAVAAYKASPQVEAVYTRKEIEAAPPPSGSVGEWSLLTRVRQSYDPERSGDFIVLLKPYVTPIPAGTTGYTATHGSVWNYDRRVPILFWWPGVNAFEQPNGIETADILPTLASFIGLDVPSQEIDGRCVDLVIGKASNCPIK